MHKSMEKYDDICELKKEILKFVHGQVSEGMTANPQEVAILGEYVDMVKDLAEAEKSCQEACYYESVVEAMEDSDMVGGRMGYNPNRNRMGQYSDGRADGGDMRSSRSGGRSQSGNMKRGYKDPYMRMMEDDMWDDDMERDPRHGEAFNRFRSAKRHYTETHSEKDKQEMKMHARDHVSEAMSTLGEIWDDADPELRKRMKEDLTKFTAGLTV